MCGGVVNDIVNDLSGAQVEQDALSSPPLPSFFSPPSHINDPNLHELPHGYTQDRVSPVTDPFINHAGFYLQVYSCLLGADEDVAPGIPQAAATMSQAIASATKDFQTSLGLLHSSADSWKGAAADAAVQNVTSSLPIPQAISDGASALGVLAQHFSATVANAKNQIVPIYGQYEADLHNYPEQADQIQQQYSTYAFNVMTSAPGYEPNISNIATNNPGFNAGPPPTVGGGTGGAGGGSGVTGGAGGGGVVSAGTGGLGSVGAGAGRSSVAVPSGNPGGPAGPETSTPAPQQSTTSPTSTPTDPPAGTYSPASAAASTPAPAGYSGSGLSSLGSSLQGLASPLQSALGQAMNAGKGGAGAPPGANGLGKPPPEGKLAIGGKGSGGLGGGGAGGGAGAHGPALAKPASAPGTTAERTVAAGSRAGLSAAPGSAGAGAPGAGAPAAGQQGGAAAGANHQPSKALRRKRNGENLIGDADAVVPVLGEPAPAEDAKPEAAPARGLR